MGQKVAFGSNREQFFSAPTPDSETRADSTFAVIDVRRSPASFSIVGDPTYRAAVLRGGAARGKSGDMGRFGRRGRARGTARFFALSRLFCTVPPMGALLCSAISTWVVSPSPSPFGRSLKHVVALSTVNGGRGVCTASPPIFPALRRSRSQAARQEIRTNGEAMGTAKTP